MSKIVMIQAYFGELPNFFELWLHSAKNNLDIDFLIFTDDNVSKYNLSPNIKVVNISFSEVSSLISKKIKMDISIENPYKMCDFRPFYGVIFDEYLYRYSHWGYFDFDLYFGQLNKFITSDLLNEYDKIGIYGHLTILKNEKKVMDVILNRDNWPYSLEYMLTSKKLFALDESGGMNILFSSPELKQKQLVISDINYMLPIWSDVRFDCAYQFFFVDKGKVYIARSSDEKKEILIEEVAYIHYQKRVVRYSNIDMDKPFYFSNDGIFNFTEDKFNSLVFSSEITKGYRKKYILKNAIKKFYMYLTNTSSFSIKIKKTQRRWRKIFSEETPTNIIRVEKL
ncbi:hypothetical protein P7G51_08860 [Enterococcus asini]|uniref:DUF6625 family protein n=1 Tax=Enterococcus asini TaxID=57732 RepID=UPI002890878A|nr:DUF6625 family protein [Enterococcus asini]MDT2757485.1 hypothetical protein [Enterococcus asini]